jgi:hypothetical protein
MSKRSEDSPLTESQQESGWLGLKELRKELQDVGPPSPTSSSDEENWGTLEDIDQDEEVTILDPYFASASGAVSVRQPKNAPLKSTNLPSRDTIDLKHSTDQNSIQRSELPYKPYVQDSKRVQTNRTAETYAENMASRLDFEVQRLSNDVKQADGDVQQHPRLVNLAQFVQTLFLPGSILELYNHNPSQMRTRRNHSNMDHKTKKEYWRVITEPANIIMDFAGSPFLTEEEQKYRITVESMPDHANTKRIEVMFAFYYPSEKTMKFTTSTSLGTGSSSIYGVYYLEFSLFSFTKERYVQLYQYILQFLNLNCGGLKDIFELIIFGYLAFSLMCKPESCELFLW